MATVVETFFGRFVDPSTTRVLGAAKGSVRFDLVDGRRTDHWRLDVRRGTASVSRSDADADCVVRTDQATFDELATGRLSALPALLQGRVDVTGDLSLLVRVQRLFPVEPHRPQTASARTIGRKRG
jgi:putative sterol carrier protein